MPTGEFYQGISMGDGISKGDSCPGWIATLVMVAPVALNLMSQGEAL